MEGSETHPHPRPHTAVPSSRPAGGLLFRMMSPCGHIPVAQSREVASGPLSAARCGLAQTHNDTRPPQQPRTACPRPAAPALAAWAPAARGPLATARVSGLHFASSRMSHGWDHTGYSLFGLASLTWHIMTFVNNTFVVNGLGNARCPTQLTPTRL